MNNFILHVLKNLLIGIVMVLIIALFYIVNCKAAREIIQLDVSKSLKNKYTIHKKINQNTIDKNKDKIQKMLKEIYFTKNINIKIIMSEHSIKETNAFTSKTKVNDYYYIIICNRNNYSIESTFLHELGHIIQFKYVNLEGYKRICYKDKQSNFEEEFAEDFRYWMNNKYKKRTKLEYSYKFNLLMGSTLKRIGLIWILKSAENVKKQNL